MCSGPPPDYTYRCPVCAVVLEVNAAMRDALLERGCVLCGAAVTGAAFTDRSPVDS